MNQIFDINRLYLLLRKETFKNPRKLAVTTIAVTGILFVLVLLISSNGPVEGLHDSLFTAVLIVGGFIYTSTVFDDLHDPTKSFSYLTLPASNLEKFLSKLFMTTVVFIAGTAIWYYLFSLVTNLVVYFLYDFQYSSFNPFQKEVLEAVAIYVTTQSVFLLGAIYFRKYNLIQTVFCLFLMGILLAATFFSIGKMITGNLQGSFDGDNIFKGNLGEALKFIFTWVMAPWFWLITYFRLKEREV